MKIWITAMAAVLLIGCAEESRAGIVSEGSPFPAWKMTAHTGDTVASADLAGKPYLLWFYPAAMTPGCTAEGRGLRDEYEAYQAAGIAVLGASFDPPKENRAFVEAESFPFLLLSDLDKQLAMAVGAATSAQQGYARRISYLVGPDGNVIKAYTEVSPSEHAAEVLADYAASLKEDEVTPAAR